VVRLFRVVCAVSLVDRLSSVIVITLHKSESESDVKAGKFSPERVTDDLENGCE